MNIAADDTTLELTRIFDASPALVFNSWIDREEWQAWLGPEGMRCEIPLLEPRVGGRYRVIMQTSDGNRIPIAGVFRAIDAPRKLVFTWCWEGDDSRQSIVTLLFAEFDGKTKLTLRQEDLGTAENRDAHGKGWNSALNKLAAHLAACV